MHSNAYYLKREEKMEQKVRKDWVASFVDVDDDTWEVLNVGTHNEETGEFIVHLKSTSRVLPGVKRDTPVQRVCWIHPTTLETRRCN